MTWHEWKRGVEIEPSLYAANFAILGEQIELLCKAGCRIFHFDVGDGHFVEPVTMGPIVLQSISSIVHRNGGAIDVHLMVEDPARYFAAVAEAGGDSATFHYEAVADVPATIRSARGQRLQAGVAFNPESDPADVARVCSDADVVLCMAIHPGYSGQPFRDETVARVAALRSALPAQVLIQVDGGVGAGNVRRLADAGAELLVTGSAIFGSDDAAAAYIDLVRAVA